MAANPAWMATHFRLAEPAETGQYLPQVRLGDRSSHARRNHATFAVSGSAHPFLPGSEDITTARYCITARNAGNLADRPNPEIFQLSCTDRAAKRHYFFCVRITALPKCPEGSLKFDTVRVFPTQFPPKDRCHATDTTNAFGLSR